MLLPRYIGFALVVIVGVATGLISRAAGATSVRGPNDRRSSLVLGIAHSVVLIAVLVLPRWRIAPLGWSADVSWAAVGVMIAAFGLQIWAMRTLGRWYSLDLTVDAAAQPVVTRAPYGRIRHPGYLGQILFFLAFSVTSRDALSIALVTAVVLAAYAWRIHVEEQLMARTFGDRWHAYVRRTRRLLPFLFF